MVKTAMRTPRFFRLPLLALIFSVTAAVSPPSGSLALAAGTPGQGNVGGPRVRASTPGPSGQKPGPSGQKKGGRAPNRNGPVELFAVNSKETLQLRLRDDKGRPLRGVQKRFDALMRCHHTKKQHPMNPRLVRMLYQVGKHYPGRRIEVVSGYRHPSVAKNPRSPHMQGLACDFRVVGVKNTELRDYLRSGYQKVGVGYYPNSAFVHLDVRKDRSAFWIDYSGPGERAIYSENAAGDLKSGRAETYKPIKIDSDWATVPEEVGDDAKPPGEHGPQGTPDDVNNPADDPSETAKSAGGAAAVSRHARVQPAAQ
ncbi:MAG: DUF882 domain-containing protein [Myxococcales bacterium]